MKTQDVMVRDRRYCRTDTKVAEAVALLVKHDISALPVIVTSARSAISLRPAAPTKQRAR